MAGVGCERKERTVVGEREVLCGERTVWRGLNEEQEGSLVLYKSNCGGFEKPRGRHGSSLCRMQGLRHTRGQSNRQAPDTEARQDQAGVDV